MCGTLDLACHGPKQQGETARYFSHGKKSIGSELVSSGSALLIMVECSNYQSPPKPPGITTVSQLQLTNQLRTGYSSLRCINPEAVTIQLADPQTSFLLYP